MFVDVIFDFKLFVFVFHVLHIHFESAVNRTLIQLRTNNFISVSVTYF